MKYIYYTLLSFFFFLHPLVAYSGIEGETTVCSGETYTYEVYADNGGIGAGTYEWYVDEVRVLSNSYTADITFSSGGLKHIIKVLYNNGTGNKVEYTLTVYPYSGGTASLSSSKVCSGGSVTLKVWGQQGSSGHTWEKKTEGGSWSSLNNGNTEYLYTKVYFKTYFRYKVSSPCGDRYSNEVVVDVYPLLEAGSVVQEPMTICHNSSPGQLEATTATGGGGGYEYQWELSTDNQSWSEISGATNTSFTPDQLTQTTYFRRKVSALCGTEETASIKITVREKLEAGSVVQEPVTICHNSSPGKLEATTATGGGGGYEYQWELSTDNQSWSEISGATNTSFTPDQLTQTTYFRQKVSALCGTEETASIKITVRENLEAGSIGGAKTVYCGSTAGTIGEVSSPAGGAEVYEYQWVKSIDQVNWELIPNQGEVSCDPPGALRETTFFKRLVTSGSCGTVESNIVAVTVEPIPEPETVNGSRCGEGEVTLSATPGTNGINCRWYDSAGNLLDTSLEFTTPHLSYGTTTYYVSSYHGLSGCESERVPVTAIIKTPPSAPVLLSKQDRIGSGEVAIKVSHSTGGDGFRLYSSEGNFLAYSSDGNFTVRVEEPTDELSVTYHFYALAVKEGCESLEKVDVPVTVYEPPVIYSSDGNKLYLNKPIVLTSSNEFPFYQWKRNGANISGANQKNLTVTTPGSYTLYVSLSGAGGFTTEAFVVEKGALTDQPTDINYIETNTVLVPGVRTEEELNQLSIEKRSQQIQYFDGLGRMVQVVTTQASPAKKDLVQPLQYDAFGREWRKYLPYAGEEHSGFYKADAVETPETYENSKQYAFYQSAHQVAQDKYPYSVAVFEPSPLNRIVEQGAPGAHWQPESGHSVKMGYKVNMVADEVIKWQYRDGSDAFGQLFANGYYPNGELYKIETEDEDGHLVREYKDKLGQLVLKEVLDEQEISHFTYYVYDDFGNLRVVLPPAFMDAWEEGGGRVQDPSNYGGYRIVNTDRTITSTADGTKYYVRRDKSLTMGMGFSSGDDFHVLLEDEPVYLEAAILNNYVFYYHYDGRQRMVEKHVPGGGVTYMVYDPWDRLVLTQDAEQRETHQWLYTKYDALNRPVITGLWIDNEGRERADLQQAILDGVTAGTFARSEEKDNSEAHGYSLDKSFPASAAADEVLTVSFYDNYDFKFSPADALIIAEEEDGPFSYTVKDGFEDKRSKRVQGQVTGTKTRVLGTDGWLNAISYYDITYRPIQIVSNNLQQGTDRQTNAYDFTGKLLKSLQEHAGKTEVAILKEFEYDHAGRLVQTWQSIDENDRVLVAENEYNSLGNLVDKKLHSEDEGGSFMQSVDYRYNIRGWLTSINNSSLAADEANDDTNDFFGMELGYTDLKTETGEASYSGNIAEVLWKNGFDHKLRAYSYSYDGLNRLKKASYKAFGTSWTDDPENDRYNVAYTYYANGNIKSLNRRGKMDENSSGAKLFGETDLLTYHYDGNRLSSVEDKGQEKFGFKGGASKYHYDDNGNLIGDEGKGIVTRYNILNLPEEVEIGEDTLIVFRYDAMARKLSEEVFVQGVSDSKQEFVGEVIYADGELSFLSHQEGKIVPGKKGWEYQYYIKDHLDNVRVLFTSKPDTLQYLASMERENEVMEDNQFDGFGNTRLTVVKELNHTPLQETGLHPEAVRLNAGRSEKTYTPGITLAVLPGDQVEAKVFAKYLDLRRSELNPNALIAALTGMVDSYTFGIDGSGATTITDPAGNVALLGGSDSGSPPQAYLNYYLFDQDFQLIDMGFAGVSSEAAVDPENLNKEHEELRTKVIEVSKAGFLRIELSHDAAEDVDIYFDDLTVVHQQSPLISTDDYYPFGLSIEGTAFHRKNFQYKGRVSDASVLPQDYIFRQYDPVLGRFTSIDPLAELTLDQSPFHYGFNNPVLYNDALGLTSVNLIEKLVKKVVNIFKAKWRFDGKSAENKIVFKGKGKSKRGGSRNDNKDDSKKEEAKSGDDKSPGDQKRMWKDGQKGKLDGSLGVQLLADDDKELPGLGNNFDPRREQERALQGMTASLNMQPARDYMAVFKQKLNSNPSALHQYYQEFEKEEYTSQSTLDGRLQAYKQYLVKHLPLQQVLGLTAQHRHQAQNSLQTSQERNIRGEFTLVKPEIFTDEIAQDGNGGGFTITYKGVTSTMKTYKVTYVKEENRYSVIDVQITDIDGGLIEHEALYKAGAVFMQKELQKKTYAKTEDATEEGKQLQERLKQHLLTLANKAIEVEGVEDLVGITLEEKQKIKEAIGKYGNRYNLSSEVIIADKKSAQKIKEEYDNGIRTPEKDVTVILGKDEEGNTSYSIVRKDGVLQPPAEKTFVDREGVERTIQLDNDLQAVEAVQDQVIAGAAANDNLPTDWDGNGIPVAPKPEDGETLSLYDRVMMGFAFTRDLVNSAEISEPFYNHTNADGTPTGLKEKNTFPIDVHPMVAAGGNIMIDEAKSIPDLVIFGGTMVLDAAEREKVIQSFQNISYEQVKSYFRERISSYNDGDKGTHNLTYDAGSLGLAVLSLGQAIKEVKDALAKAGKMGDFEKMLKAEVLDEIDFPKEKRQRLVKDAADNPKLKEAIELDPLLADAWNVLDDAGYMALKKDPLSLKKLRSLLKNPKLADAGLDENMISRLISGNRSAGGLAAELDELTKGLDELVSSGTKFEDIGKLATDLEKGENFAVGAAWIQRYITSNVNDFSGKTLIFESVEKAGETVRRVDVKMPDGNATKYFEFKSVSEVPPSNFAIQFVKDMQISEVSDLGQIKWLFDGRKLSSFENNVDDFIDALDQVEIPQSVIDKLTPGAVKTKDALLKAIEDRFDDIFQVK